MGNIDGLKEQVEELKQRLNETGAQQGAAPNELKNRLATIKASLESKQGEITKLSSEKQQLVTERQQLVTEKQRLATEIQRLAGENEQLRRMLQDVLAALEARTADAASNILGEFLAETDPLIQPKGESGEAVIAAGPPADQGHADQGQSTDGAQPEPDQSESAQPEPAQPEPAQSEAADQTSAPAPTTESESDEEESPALRRIMKRGRRATG